MSGIAAVIQFDGRPVDDGIIEQMTEAMDYRGADGIHHWVNGPVALGHCMFRTTQEALEETQPLCNEDESLALVFDGWLSNWQELRGELLARGAKLRTRADAELVLRAYETWGNDCPKYIDGEFAFLIWDKHRREAYCARDHLGIKPLHYHFDGARLIVASDIAGILAHPKAEQRPNRGMISEFLAGDWLSLQETIWEGILRSKQAHWMRFGRSGIQTGEYWSPSLEERIEYGRDEEYFEHYRTLLTDSVRRASRTHRPLGCEVSGGLDSSGVFGIAHELGKRGQLLSPELKGYTFVFEEKDSAADEISFARAVGKHVGESICEVPPFLPELSWFKARGRADRDLAPYPNGAMTKSIHDAAVADQCRVILNGDGGDEWLTGSQFYYAEYLAMWNWSGLSRSLRTDCSNEGSRKVLWWLFRYGFVQFLPENLLEIRRRLLSRFRPTSAGNADWLKPELQRLFDQRRARSNVNFRQVPDRVRRRLLQELHNPFQRIGRDHRARQCARSGIEPRSPMNTRSLIEFAFATPERIRCRGSTNKYIHRKALSGVIPDIIINRPDKAEFGVAFQRQVGGTRDLLINMAEEGMSAYLDQKGLAKLFDRYSLIPHGGNPMWQLWGIFGCANALDSE